LIDLTLIRFGWRFDADLFRLIAGVIFVIGNSMIALAVLIWLPRWLIAAVALVWTPSEPKSDNGNKDKSEQ